MSVFRREQNQVHSMRGNHIVGVATPTSGAQQVEMWYGRMDANSATPAGHYLRVIYVPDPEPERIRQQYAARFNYDLGAAILPTEWRET